MFWQTVTRRLGAPNGIPFGGSRLPAFGGARGDHGSGATVWLSRLFVLLLVGGVVGRLFGQCETNERPFEIVDIRPTDNGGVVVTWTPTRTNEIFGVFSADGFLGNDTVWTSRGGVWGDETGVMSWTDTTAMVASRFYKVVRIVPTADSDWDGDGIPDPWETDYGLNPFDARDASIDPDEDGADNLTEFLQGRDPHKNAVPDAGGFVKLQVFTQLE